MTTTHRRALVTGAASGLGKAIATRYVQAGWKVLLTDVDDEALAIAGKDLARIGDVATRRLDVRQESDFERARTWCEDTWGGLDLLVNNAGVGAGGRMELVPLEDWDWIIDLNLKSVVRGCRTFIPVFKQQGSGQILNVASVAGLALLPAMASYNTTKAAVIALSQTLRYELQPYGIGVSVLCPAFVNTNLATSFRSPDEPALKLAARMMEGAKVTAEQVAEKAYTGLEKDRFMIISHPEGHVIRTMGRIAPGRLEKAVGKRWGKLRLRFEKADREVQQGGTS